LYILISISLFDKFSSLALCIGRMTSSVYTQTKFV
jgi:hypothetical protein